MRDRKAELDEMTQWAQEAADEAKKDFFPFAVRVVHTGADPSDAPAASFLADDFIAEGKISDEVGRSDGGPLCVDAVMAYQEMVPRSEREPPPLRRLSSKPKNPLTGTPKPKNPRRK